MPSTAMQDLELIERQQRGVRSTAFATTLESHLNLLGLSEEAVSVSLEDMGFYGTHEDRLRQYVLMAFNGTIQFERVGSTNGRMRFNLAPGLQQTHYSFYILFTKALGDYIFGAR